MLKDELGDRMKKYEYITRSHLIPRMPVIVRIDGKAFHTFTKGFKKPFDNIMVKTMQDTMKYLCENIQGCVLGYTQSDEITLVLVDYKKLTSDSWFDYNIQKCSSVAASMATMAFNRFFSDNTDFASQYYDEIAPTEATLEFDYSVYQKKFNQAMFDARVFNIAKEEVCNNLLWRQNDASRNSVQMVGRAYFSNKELFKKSTNDIIQMLKDNKDVDWEGYPTTLKRGSCCIKQTDPTTGRSMWIIDDDIPVFKGEDRNYIDSLIYVGE